MSREPQISPAEHRRATLDAYERLAPVWSAATDDGAWNAWLERPALRAVVPRPLRAASVLDAGCGSGAQCEWLADEGAHVTGVDLSPSMIDQARRRCGERVTLIVADLANPLPLPAQSLDGVTCSLVLHYLEDWSVPLRSFWNALRPGGWVALSLDHPFSTASPSERNDYFASKLVSDTWTKAGITVTQRFWRRPLGMAVDAFSAAGFAIDRVVEARPTHDALARFPELIAAAERPSFIVYRLIKLASQTRSAAPGDMPAA